MIRVGIIGCGKIADAHAEQIRRIPGCALVGACDREELMARQMCERYRFEGCYTDVRALLEGAGPDVVHIATPPQSHYELGALCLNAGCSIYVEKPFTLTTPEAEALIRLACDQDLKITVGHNAQFSHAALRMRELIRSGFLGGDPVHMESYYCYNLGDPKFAKAFLGDRDHWVRKLPGGLLHNIIGHGIIKIAGFFKSDAPTVIAHGFTSPMLRGIGETGIIDELRVIVTDGSATTAYFTFSSQMKPTLHRLCLYGPENALVVDDDNQTVIKVRGTKYKSYLDHFVLPLVSAGQQVSNVAGNLKKFLKNDFHMDAGRKHLIEAFYGSVSGRTAPPIPYRDILLTSRIMDAVFRQLGEQQQDEPAVHPAAVNTPPGGSG